MSAKRDRALYKIAGAAGRQALDRAAKADPPLTDFERRVLDAVLALTALYSKLVDRMHVAQVAAFVYGFGSGRLPKLPEPEDGRKRPRDWRIVETARALKRLDERGIAIYRPARGRGRLSLIGLPEAVEKGGEGAPLSDGEKGGEVTRLFDGKRGGDRPLKGGSSSSPPPEKLPRRKRARGESARGEDLETVRRKLISESFSTERVEVALSRVEAQLQNGGKPKTTLLRWARGIAKRLSDDELTDWRAEIERAEAKRAEADRLAACARCDEVGRKLDGPGPGGRPIEPVGYCDHEGGVVTEPRHQVPMGGAS